MTETVSNLLPALERLTIRSARAMVARARLAPEGLNRLLLRAFALPPGEPGALLADPVIEIARAWKPGAQRMEDLAPGLLSPDLVAALDSAGAQAFPRTASPHAHQLDAWQESLTQGRSVLVAAGTGAGKTECFLIPVLQHCLAFPHPGGGVRAILLYPLNALIESQRERLRAWAERLDGRVRFALLNGDTPETERKCLVRSDRVELRSREAIRACPPEILVTNITMVEYLLLRAADRTILEVSQGALNWIVLDEAHSYVGSQAAEMALLLRRVRAAFGVEPGDVRLMATSATIGGEADTLPKLRAFAAALAGKDEDHVAVIEGREAASALPVPGPEVPLDPADLAALDPEAAGTRLAPHPRVQALRRTLSSRGLRLAQVAEALFGDAAQRDGAAAILDAAGRAVWQGRPLMPWRAHLFHRAQGGVWACPDPACPHRAPELAAAGAGWPFGAVWLTPRARCACDAPVYEVVGCTDCGTVQLQGLLQAGAQPRLDPPEADEGDDFALDAEPEDEDAVARPTGMAWLAVPDEDVAAIWLAEDGHIFDNAPPEGLRAWRLRLIERPEDRGCCAGAARARLQGLCYGPAFLMGNALASVLEDLAPPAEFPPEAGGAGPEAPPPRPASGRRALTFTDSRQGVARLAAKLQQEAERSLTRAFLWHAVQEGRQADPADTATLCDKIAKMEAAGLGDYTADDRRRLDELTGAAAAPIPWPQLVRRLADHADVVHFAGEIWRRRWRGQAMGDDPAKLAEMFLYREMFRRPRVQNNPETLGLLRLTFPKMEERARLSGPPRPLAEAGFDAEAWAGLAQAAVDMVFRQSLAVDMAPWMVPLVAPRFGRLNGIVPTGTRGAEMPPNTRRWPGPVPAPNSRLGQLAELVYTLIGGSPESPIDQDLAGAVLAALWDLISTTAARDCGAGAYRLEFPRASLARLDRAFLCPVTRRPYAYSLNGRSPNDPARSMVPLDLPRLPLANAGGLAPDQRAEVTRWTETDPQVAALRARGLWTDLHDRLAAFSPYVRAQEHSAQIPRATLKRYEADFASGRINLLNCSTTMEMGVDLADVRLVVNGNVPPSLSNYRQRAGRAGRRGEPWAFTLTFCRDLPLDRRVFADPLAFLGRPIVAPKVWLDSPALVQRHVNAALLSAWLGQRGGTAVTGTIGAFLGADNKAEAPVLADAPADALLADLDAGRAEGQPGAITALVRGTALADQRLEVLTARTRATLDELVVRWRREHLGLLDAAAAAADRAAREALELRAKRLRGEFLLGEMARRGFTPAYGFPTDVVSFANLAHRPEDGDQGHSHFCRGTASRALGQAIREYAPGAEVVIDGLVYRSEGILPAWEAGADASGLEDLRDLWSCPACHAFGLESLAPETCPSCGHPTLDHRKVLRPAGFLGATPAHVGYENLAHVAPDPVRLSAQGGAWRALPEGAGRLRADPSGRAVVSTAGPEGGGFAVCLDCGRAEGMSAGQHGSPVPLPQAILRHRPLLRGRRLRLTHDGLCPASDQPQRIQRPLHLAQITRSDVWEWQLPSRASAPAALALAAALRESLTERLGVEADEVLPVASPSTGPDGAARLSVFLYDRAAGGAGLSARLAEPEMLEAALARAEVLLDCREGCARGCPACILRPDLNRREFVLDRPGALALARALRPRLALPEVLRLFGPESRLSGQPAAARAMAVLRGGGLFGLDLWLHGAPDDWDLAGWSVRTLLPRLAEAKIRPRLHLASAALTAKGFDLARKLALHALAQGADLHHAATLPQVAGHPVVMRLATRGYSEALAVTDPAEAVPGPDWGAGAAAPAILGPASDLPAGAKLSAARLMELGLGNARLLWPGSEIDGAAGGFGRRFWQWLARAAPLEIGAMQAVGVTALRYTDRYLLQAYTLRLLAEVLAAAPGAGGAARRIALARADRPPAEPRLVHDAFATDAQRQAVLVALMPGAEVELGRKEALPHQRALISDLADGRRLTILLDQGLGNWRVEGSPRHDFANDPPAQARSLKAATFRVVAGQVPGAPIALTLD